MSNHILNQPTVSRQDFRRALNLRCHQTFGLGLMDLPDVICIDDNWWEGQTSKEAHTMIESCIEELQDEVGFNVADTPIYDINE